MDIPGWRVTHLKYAPPSGDPLDGAGAERAGGRWNSPGHPVVYLSWTVSLAVLETLVHADDLESLVYRVMASVRFHAEDVTDVLDTVDPLTMTTKESRGIGDDWLSSRKSPILRIPSVVIPAEPNYVLNVLHPDYRRIRATATEWKPLPIDRRLLGLK
jgi:RES domain-containing protein